MEKMDSLTGPVVYIGDTFKDIELLQKSYVGISRGGLADPKVVENSDARESDSQSFHDSEIHAQVDAPDATSDSLGTGLEAILARRGA